MWRSVSLLVSCGVLACGSARAEDRAADIAVAVPRAVGYLERVSLAWKDRVGCASCHHVPMAVWASAEAERKGMVVDTVARGLMRSFILQEDNASGLLPTANPPPERDGAQLGGVYALLALGAGPRDWAGEPNAVHIRNHFLKLQLPDGAWPPFPSAGRSPIFEPGGVSARMVLLGLGALAEAREDSELSTALQKGYTALGGLPDGASHQMQVLQLLMDLRFGGAPEKVGSQLEALLAMQRPEGSWAQTPDMIGDAFATGQTLYALGKAGLQLGDARVDRGVDVLLRTQRGAGDWRMESRSTPGGPDASNLEPIEAAATGWAVLGMLAVSGLPEASP